tara:strand:+ start:8985 stop:9698 length:714 start_codon:yes stop_codon:yes gene_type:complete
MKILITICARGGSKGLPGKNIKPLNGQPLIAYSIKNAKEISTDYDCDIALSTDCERIKNTVKQYLELDKYLRPPNLSTDSASKVETIKHLLLYHENQKKIKYDLILDLDVSSPMRTKDDLKKSLDMVINDKECINLFSVSKAKKNPYFNMVEKKDNGYYDLVSKGQQFSNRQSTPDVYEMNASFYIYKREFFDMKKITPFSERSLAYIMPNICFDIDHKIDFLFLDYLIQTNKVDLS